ncbi:hypothetical protein UY3_14032 [Chelonia mydas]|uniref:Uncharacterized protein n=1 Tax=Chelonia mydas TaxID=8469 RepID=M7ATY4_CHEMY|nr:hypothetical protein UY3_14032 [Chelonia mydas]
MDSVRLTGALRLRTSVLQHYQNGKTAVEIQKIQTNMAATLKPVSRAAQLPAVPTRPCCFLPLPKELDEKRINAPDWEMTEHG